MVIYGDVLTTDDSLINYNKLIKLIKFPIVKPLFKISILNPDETVNYEIPSSDILEDGISYTEEYTSGQRRNITLKLINNNNKYTPSINGMWLNTKFSFQIGIQSQQEVIWFQRGVYLLGDISEEVSNSNKIITLQLKDKFSLFEGNNGTLEESYEIEIGSNAEEVIKGLLNFPTGNGYLFDYKKPIFDPSFVGFQTQATIRIDEGGNMGQVIQEIATQMSAEYYYNNQGNLCFYPIQEAKDDSNKPIIWVFDKIKPEIQNLSLNYKNEDIVNIVKVVGDNIENGLSYAVATNDNPRSPICVQQIGRRAAPTKSESNIWNNELAKDLAEYYLRQSSFLAVDFSTSVPFNPILSVNNICELESNDLNLHREKLLLTSISFSSPDGNMSLKLCNTSDLPFVSSK